MRFLIDANGILNVTARDGRTGREQSVEVKPSYGLTDDQVEAMIQESFDKAEDDFRERQVREARVEADRLIAAVSKSKNSEAFAQLPEAERNEIDRVYNELQVVYHSDDYAFIRSKMQELDEVTHHLAEILVNTAVSGALKGTKI